MPRTVRERAKIPTSYDDSSIQKIRLLLKPFVCMPSIAGGERMWIIQRMQAILNQLKKH
jgi:hypothetical protein